MQLLLSVGGCGVRLLRSRTLLLQRLIGYVSFIPLYSYRDVTLHRCSVSVLYVVVVAQSLPPELEQEVFEQLDIRY